MLGGKFMPMLVTGPFYEEHGDCSELKRQIQIEKCGLRYVARAFERFDFVPINKGRFRYKRLLKDIEEYKQTRKNFYNGWNSEIVFINVEKWG